MSESTTALIKKLETVFGGPSDAGFGFAVFHVPAANGNSESLEAAAKRIYRQFLGESWDAAGEATWLGSWKVVFQRAGSPPPTIIDGLQSIDDPMVPASVPLLFDALQDPAAARVALTASLDDPQTRTIIVFNIGDGEAMSGLLIAGERDTLDRVFVVALMD